RAVSVSSVVRRRPPGSLPFPYTTLFRSKVTARFANVGERRNGRGHRDGLVRNYPGPCLCVCPVHRLLGDGPPAAALRRIHRTEAGAGPGGGLGRAQDRKSVV